MFNEIKKSGRIFTLALFFGLLSAVFLSFGSFNASCEEIRQNVLRLHIIANSDSTEDQNLKLQIRDAILENSEEIFEKAESLDSAIAMAEKKLPEIEKIANDVIKEKGFSYKADAHIGKSFFETRDYDGITLPAGVYESLIIDVGKGSGKNWWCVIFPEICIPSATKTGLSKTVSEDSVRISENSNRYILRFKTVEIYEEIKNLFKR